MGRFRSLVLTNRPLQTVSHELHERRGADNPYIRAVAQHFPDQLSIIRVRDRQLVAPVG